MIGTSRATWSANGRASVLIRIISAWMGGALEQRKSAVLLKTCAYSSRVMATAPSRWAAARTVWAKVVKVKETWPA